MHGSGWQQERVVTVAGGGTVAVPLPTARPLLEQLTVWASSGARQLVNASFQARVNGKAFGTSVSIVGAIAADIVFAESVTVTGAFIVPQGTGHLYNPDPGCPQFDPFDFDVLVSNGDVNPMTVTLYFAAVERAGGSKQLNP